MNTNQALTGKEVQEVFNCSHMTVYSWREKLKMPVHREKGSRLVLYPIPALRKWAKAQGIEIVVNPTKLVEARKAVKPGPKART